MIYDKMLVIFWYIYKKKLWLYDVDVTIPNFAWAVYPIPMWKQAYSQISIWVELSNSGLVQNFMS